MRRRANGLRSPLLGLGYVPLSVRVEGNLVHQVHDDDIIPDLRVDDS